MKTFEIIDKDTIKVYSNTGVKDYCTFSHTSIREFNKNVIIDKSVTDCSEMFEGCSSFNQPVVIPNSVTDCSRMFSKCISFNQFVFVPKSVKVCWDMIQSCSSFTNFLIVPETCEYGAISYWDCINTGNGIAHLDFIKLDKFDIRVYFYVPEGIKSYRHLNLLSLFNGLLDSISSLRSNPSELVDELIDFAIANGLHESYVGLTGYKRDNNLYKDSPNDLKAKFSLDDDNDSDNGETNLF